MNLSDNSHLVVIPKHEYEAIRRVVEEKQNIDVTFCISLRRSAGYGNWEENQVDAFTNIHELNDEKISEGLIQNTNRLIRSACNEVAKEKEKELKELRSELKEIYSKWWYKLFA